MLPEEARAEAVHAQPVEFTLGGIAFLGDGPHVVAIGAGAFDVITDDDGTAAELRLEYRYGGKWRSLGPMVGIMANSDGSIFGYAGFYTDIRIADRWIVTPAAGIGAYEPGDSKNLGGTLQFHLGLDVSYRFDGGHRLGLKIAHISDARVHEENPGVESLLLIYTIPWGR